MPSIEVRIADPMAVPRAVVSCWIAVTSASVSVVGGTCTPASPAKATSPIFGPPACDFTKAMAACSATVMRLGETSVEHMDAETSIANMMVVELLATGTVACGRAAPTPSTAKPSTNSSTGMRLVHRVRPGSAARTAAIEVTVTVDRRRRRLVHQAMPSTSGMSKQRQECPRPAERHQTNLPVRTTVSTAPAASSSSANPMNAPASGTCSSATVSRRSMLEATPSSWRRLDAG